MPVIAAAEAAANATREERKRLAVRSKSFTDSSRRSSSRVRAEFQRIQEGSNKNRKCKQSPHRIARFLGKDQQLKLAF